MKIWNVHWGFHTQAPCVLLDDFEIHNAEYGLWRPNFDRHAYRGLRMEDIEVEKFAGPMQHEPPTESRFPKPLAPIDDLAPVTVITHVGRSASGRTAVRGTTSDCGVVRRVQVNGRDVRALQPNFAEWEIFLDERIEEVVVRAEDSAGNIGAARRLVGV